MKQTKLIIILFSVLLFNACSSSGDKIPDWVDGNPSQYPPNAYLSGHGQSEYRAVAQDRARADLSKIFQVKINEESLDTTDYKSQSIEGKQQQQLESSASRYIKTRTEQIISGIKIAQVWHDEKNKQYHALAILDRNQASHSLRNIINQLDSATEHEIARAKQSDLFQQISHASRALSAQYQRQVNQQLLVIIDPTGIGVRPRYNLAYLKSSRDALLKRLNMNAEIDSDSVGGIKAITIGAIATAGFNHVTREEADYTLVTNLDMEPFKDKQGWYWYRGALQIDLVDARNRKSNGSHRWEIKVSAQRQETAEQRVRDKADQILTSELRDVVIQFGIAKK